MIAGGGGGCQVHNSGSNFMWTGGGGGGLMGGNAFNIFTRLFQAQAGGGGGGTQSNAGSGAGQWNGANYNNSNGAGGGGWYGGGTNGSAGGGGSGLIGTNVKYSYIPQAITSTSIITPGAGSNITAPGSNFMTNVGYSPNTYAHGGGGTGLIVLFPVTSSNAAFIGVDARFTSV
jgi:hypothetical protein